MSNSFSEAVNKKPIGERIDFAKNDGYQSCKLGFLSDDNPYNRTGNQAILFRAWHAGWIAAAAEVGKS